MLARAAQGSSGFALPNLAAGRPDAGLSAARAGRRLLRVFFIKPSRYDDDGYVLAYRWGVIPNNTFFQGPFRRRIGEVTVGLDQQLRTHYPQQEARAA